MDKKIKILMAIEIPGLFTLLDMSSMHQELDTYIENYSNLINISDLEDWKLLIFVNLRNTNGIGIFKRARRYPSEKEFDISISMTVPDFQEAHYGISNKNGFYVPLDDKKFYILQPYFAKYDDLHHYILETAKQAVDAAFTYGFTCNGKRIMKQK